MRSLEEVRAVAGRGLEGDRYFDQTRTYSQHQGPNRQLTLIEGEVLEALGRDYRTKVDPGDAQRNLVTRGVPLNHLVGRTFRVGEVTARGIRLCEPCGHLAGLVKVDVVPGLLHRGGHRAEILTTELIRVGDVLEELSQPGETE